MLTFRQLEAFRAVIDAGSVVKASEIMGLSQPAVSRLLTNLEATIGYRLFNRRRGRLVPLDEARELYEEVDRSFVGLDRIAEAAERIARRKTTQIRIAALPGLTEGPLNVVMARILRNRPSVFLTMESRTRFQILEGLTLGVHDIGIASMPIDGPGLATRWLASSESVCLVPEVHPLGSKSVISPGDLDGVACIMPADRTPMRLKLDQIFRDAGSSPDIRAEVTTAQSARALVALGAAVCVSWRIMHDHAVRHFLSRQTI